MKKIMKLALILSLLITVGQIIIRCFLLKDIVYINACHHNPKIFFMAQIMFLIGLFSSLTFIFYFIRMFIQKYILNKNEDKQETIKEPAQNSALNSSQHQETKHI